MSDHPTVREHGTGDAPRQTIGAYTPVRELGRGSNAVVYLARRDGVERSFALKVLHPTDEEGLARFRREAQLAARLDHPGIVPVVDHGHAHGRSFLVMEHVPGRTLREHLAGAGAWPWQDATALVIEIADAVQVAHAAGIVHRDLKPANILIDERDGRPKVTDFGLARDSASTDALTRTGDFLGTPSYMAPEQIMGQRVDARADVYALGVILYELISGAPPFVAADFPETCRLILRGHPATPRESAADLHPAVEAVCLAALTRDFTGRPANAGVLATALREALAAASATPRGAALGRAPWIAAAVLLLVSAMALGWGWSRSGALEGERQARRAADAKVAVLTRELAERQRQSPGPNPGLEREAELQRDLAGLREINARLRLEGQKTSAQLRGLGSAMAQPRPGTRETLETVTRDLHGKPDAAAVRARLLIDLGWPDEALAAIEEARRAGVKDLDLLVLAFQAHLKQNHHQAASEVLRQIEESAPPESPQRILAQVARSGGIRSEPEADRVLQIARETQKSYLFQTVNQYWARTAATTRDVAGFKRALEASEQALRLAPSDPDLIYEHSANLYHQWLGGGRQDRSACAQVLLLLRRARDIRPQSIYWIYVGKSLITMLDEPQPALPELEEAVRRADSEGAIDQRALARSWLGVAHLLLGDEARAERTWREAIDMAPGSPNTWRFADNLDRASAGLRERMLRDAPPQVRAMLQNRPPR